MKPRAIRNTAELRAFLLRGMVAANAGEMDAATSKAICNFAQQVHNTLTVELRAAVIADQLGVKKIAPVDL